MATVLIPIRQMVDATEAEGPGLRAAIWLQGCPLRCPGCCNPEMLGFELPVGIAPRPVESLRTQLRENRDRLGIEGVSLLGGEPFAHVAASTEIARAARDLDLGLMIYSGFTLAELRDRHDEGTDALLALTDLLVDGPYDRSRPEPATDGRRWIGSTNQQLHFLSPRYAPDDPAWRARNTVEVRLSRDGELSVNGFPSSATRGIQQSLTWRRPAAK
jgi:anaerobic ribonucleoside-triphosphate reductase activating protein